jgi:hypothetical protein
MEGFFCLNVDRALRWLQQEQSVMETPDHSFIHAPEALHPENEDTVPSQAQIPSLPDLPANSIDYLSVAERRESPRSQKKEDTKMRVAIAVNKDLTGVFTALFTPEDKLDKGEACVEFNGSPALNSTLANEIAPRGTIESRDAV